MKDFVLKLIIIALMLKYCSFVLYATGIKHKCIGAENCEILKNLKN